MQPCYSIKEWLNGRMGSFVPVSIMNQRGAWRLRLSIMGEQTSIRVQSSNTLCLYLNLVSLAKNTASKRLLCAKVTSYQMLPCTFANKSKSESPSSLNGTTSTASAAQSANLHTYFNTHTHQHSHRVYPATLPPPSTSTSPREVQAGTTHSENLRRSAAALTGSQISW